MFEKQNLIRRYTLLLQAYVQSSEEKYLVDIEQLGRQMAHIHLPLEDIGELHDAAIGELLAVQPSATKMRAASMPLTQLLMAYGIVFSAERPERAREQALAGKREQQYQLLFESSMDAMMMLDETGFMRGNEAAIRIFGCHSGDDFLGRHPAEFSPSTQPCGTDSMTLARKRIVRALNDGSSSFEWIHKRLDGTEFPAEILLSALELDGKRVLQATVRDISRRKQAEEWVRKLSSAIEQAGESVVITDRAGIIEYVNPAFTRVTGYSAEEAIGNTPRLLKSGHQDCAFYEDMWQTIARGNIWKGKIIDKRKNDSFYPAMLTISPIMDTSLNITHFVGIQSDLSLLEDMEHRFHQAQKMETVGTMVGGIAHNFNNMLAGMNGNIYLAKKELGENPKVTQRLSNVEALSRNAADMIQQLLAFARKDVVSMQAMQLSPFIKETMKLLHASVPENITFYEDICSDDLQIKGDATQLHQVLANLVSNARDAVEHVAAACITVRMQRFSPDDSFLDSHPWFKTGAFAHLSVEDNGYGVSAKQMQHLFEPFFTTKEQGKGTGLGLAMVYGAVKTHQGFVDINSKQGIGTIVHLYIPLLKSKVVCAEPVSQQVLSGHGELILLADDERVVRNVMAEILESLGYQVLQASDGLEAMELFKLNQQDVALAILDMVMPHCDGMVLAKQIRAVNPDVPVMFLTGYDKEQMWNNSESIPNSEALTKPANLGVLSHRMRQMLD
ncbi:MAG: PAS domain S-box protein [Mariprofundus sp.]|nr:PAS domain S-box protein [Mariprofundus sp.]